MPLSEPNASCHSCPFVIGHASTPGCFEGFAKWAMFHSVARVAVRVATLVRFNLLSKRPLRPAAHFPSKGKRGIVSFPRNMCLCISLTRPGSPHQNTGALGLMFSLAGFHGSLLCIWAQAQSITEPICNKVLQVNASTARITTSATTKQPRRAKQCSIHDVPCILARGEGSRTP